MIALGAAGSAINIREHTLVRATQYVLLACLTSCIAGGSGN